MMIRLVPNIVFVSIFACVIGVAVASPRDTYKVEFSRMAKGCNIRLHVPPTAVVTGNPENRGSGSVTVDNPRALRSEENIEPFYTGFICYRDDDGTVQRGWARFDSASQAWKPNLDPEEEKQLKGAFHFYPLQAANRSGWAVTVNDISGDEDTRRRTLHYCLINPPKALCGHGDVGYLKDGRKGDLTDYALKILRSIEFLPDESSTSETIQPTQ